MTLFERLLLAAICLAGLFSMITVEGEISILDRRIAAVEIAAGIKHNWMGLGD
jgi:hypothetical protein